MKSKNKPSGLWSNACSDAAAAFPHALGLYALIVAYKFAVGWPAAAISLGGLHVVIVAIGLMSLFHWRRHPSEFRWPRMTMDTAGIGAVMLALLALAVRYGAYPVEFGMLIFAAYAIMTKRVSTRMVFALGFVSLFGAFAATSFGTEGVVEHFAVLAFEFFVIGWVRAVQEA